MISQAALIAFHAGNEHIWPSRTLLRKHEARSRLRVMYTHTQRCTASLWDRVKRGSAAGRLPEHCELKFVVLYVYQLCTNRIK
jgi:hypothetical protein